LFSQIVFVQWDVQNIGPGATTGSVGWQDRLRVGSSTVFRSKQLRLVGAVAGSPNSGYSITAPIRVPDGLQGNQTVFVDVDVYDNIFEGRTDTNNQINGTLNVILSPPPDFAILSVLIPASSQPGITFTVTYVAKATPCFVSVGSTLFFLYEDYEDNARYVV
jgi:hypothetical protein